MPQNSVGVNREFDVPALRVRGFHPRYRSQWPQLYQALQTSEIAITEVDWRSDRKSTRLNSSHSQQNRMPSSA